MGPGLRRDDVRKSALQRMFPAVVQAKTRIQRVALETNPDAPPSRRPGAGRDDDGEVLAERMRQDPCSRPHYPARFAARPE